MFHKRRPEVLVVGAGPVGLFSALSLAERSIEVEVIDEAPTTASHSYALALHPRSLELLDGLGINPVTIQNSLRIDKVAFYEGSDRRAVLRLSDLPAEFPYALILRQSHLEDLLERALEKRKTKVKWLHRLSHWALENGGIRADFDKLDKVTTGYPIASSETQLVHEFHHEVPFLIGADGHHSIVRRQLEIEYEEVGPAQLFGVFEFEGEPPVRDEVRVVLTADSMNVLWPLPDGRCRWSFQMEASGVELEDVHYKSRLLVQSGRDYFPHLTRELLVHLIEERAPWFTVIPGEVFWSALVRFESRLAAGFGRDRVWLAGDAIHMTGPVGVQSMNVGLREANRLAEKIEEVQRGAYDPSRISTYEAKFRSEWQQLLGLGGGLTAGPRTDEWVASNRHRILPSIPASGRDLELLAEQIGLAFATTELTGAA